MKLISSGAITDIEKCADDSYKFKFRLYDSETKFPSNIGRFYNMINFELMQYHCFIQDVDDFKDDEIRNAHLVMEAGIPYDGTNFYLMLHKSNTDIINRLKEQHYEFEVFMNEENPVMCTLRIIDSKLLRTDKLKRIKEKINN